MIALFSLTLFLNAFLLFAVQPMAAKELLPFVGGAAAVWIACMLFFQAALLAGYSYAWLVPRRIGFKLTALGHLGLLAVAAIWLPAQIPTAWAPPTDSTPFFWLIELLFLGLGMPLLAIAASAPLLQALFARTSHFTALDPYFLYAASNLGSILALIAYPFIFESWLTLEEQRVWWNEGLYAVLVLTLLCVAASWRSRMVAAGGMAPGKFTSQPKRIISTNGSPMWWTLLAFMPSSLLLGVTTYLTTDLAAVPLLWVLPLALYLLTFVLTFSRRPLIPHRWMVRVLPVTVVAMTLTWLVQATEPLVILVAAHLFLQFVVSMVCHGSLALARPSVDRLGTFYFFLALGGVFGGIFNGLLAPLVFPGLFEYPVVLVLACVLAPPAWGKLSAGAVSGDIGWPIGLAVFTGALALLVPAYAAVTFGVAAVVCYTMAGRPRRFALGVAALFIAGSVHEGGYGKTIYRHRDFFGIHRVTISADGKAHLLVHGNTVHGMQWLDPARSREALTYFHARGPIGSVFTLLRDRGDHRPVAIVGLGTGALASYAQVGQEFTFYEIDPAVVGIATNPRLFTFLRDSLASPRIVRGDGRLALTQAPDDHYALIVIDAFSSDAIPLHLLTREALAIYRAKLAKGGMLVFHVSNRYLDLAPVLGDMAGDAGMACSVCHDTTGVLNQATGIYPSQWVLLAQQKLDLPSSALWITVDPRTGVPVWTDSYCNLAGALRWK